MFEVTQPGCFYSDAGNSLTPGDMSELRWAADGNVWILGNNLMMVLRRAVNELYSLREQAEKAAAVKASRTLLRDENKRLAAEAASLVERNTRLADHAVKAKADAEAACQERDREIQNLKDQVTSIEADRNEQRLRVDVLLEEATRYRDFIDHLKAKLAAIHRTSQTEEVLQA